MTDSNHRLQGEYVVEASVRLAAARRLLEHNIAGDSGPYRPDELAFQAVTLIDQAAAILTTRRQMTASTRTRRLLEVVA